MLKTFAKLPSSPENYIRAAARNGKVLRIKYHPSKIARTLVGWRTVSVLNVYSRKGVLYALCWFIAGSSDSGLTGYRLYIVENIKAAEYIDGTGNFPQLNTYSVHKGSHKFTRSQQEYLLKIFKKLYESIETDSGRLD